VDDRHAAHRRHAADQLLVQLVHHRRRIVEFRQLPSLGPPAHLALDEALGLAEITEVAGRRVEGVEISHGVHQGERDPAGDVPVRPHGGGQGGADHLTTAPFHEEEVGTEDGVVVAEEIGARRPVEVTPESREHLVLALHVVGARRDLAHRRSAQHQLRVAQPQEIREVGGAVRKLQHVERPRHAG
jgi:hypothetical protein